LTVKPFTINVSQDVLDDLQKRLKRTRWPDQVEDAGWDYGTNLDYLKELVAYWQDGYDWRKQEAALNQFANYTVEIDGVNIHFIHERGKGPNPMPILLLHGWPDSFYRFYKLIPILTDPASYGGDPADSFDVIVPSFPNFGFSDIIAEQGWNLEKNAPLLHQLMTQELGYDRYVAHGGDGGSPLAQALAVEYPDSVAAIHLTDIGYHNMLSAETPNLSEVEQKQVEESQSDMQESAYVMIQGTKPQSLAYGLMDSPVGLAGWIIEKFYSWSDDHGNIEKTYTKDELLTNLMIYWVTQTINAANRGYREGMQGNGRAPWTRVEVPVALALFPADISGLLRETAERALNIQRWTEMPKGGHFTALEQPEPLAEDLRAFFKDYRA
jgi:pimeloyl-ACP methyl ester carboxylesterase